MKRVAMDETSNYRGKRFWRVFLPAITVVYDRKADAKQFKALYDAAEKFTREPGQAD